MNEISDRWSVGEVALRGFLGMILAGLLWSFGYQYLYVAQFPVSNPPSSEELLSNAFLFSGIVCAAGVVPVAVIVIMLARRRKCDSALIMKSVLIANCACGVPLLMLVLLIPALLLLIPLGIGSQYLALIVARGCDSG